MSHLTALTVAQLLDAFASGEPLPAGGSASALAGAAGVSLLLKVTTTAGADRRAYGRLEALHRIRDELITLVDRDPDAYADVLAARRMPRATEQDAAARKERIAEAMRQATGVPLDAMRACRDALGEAVNVAGHASRAVRADAGAAVDLLLAALAGAAGCVDANLGSMSDDGFVERARRERERLGTEGAQEGRRAREALGR